MHVLVTYFVHVGLPEILFHRLDGVRAIFLVGVLLSEIFENDFILKVAFGKSKLFNVETSDIQSAG